MSGPCSMAKLHTVTCTHNHEGALFLGQTPHNKTHPTMRGPCSLATHCAVRFTQPRGGLVQWPNSTWQCTPNHEGALFVGRSLHGKIHLAMRGPYSLATRCIVRLTLYFINKRIITPRSVTHNHLVKETDKQTPITANRNPANYSSEPTQGPYPLPRGHNAAQEQKVRKQRSYQCDRHLISLTRQSLQWVQCLF